MVIFSFICSLINNYCPLFDHLFFTSYTEKNLATKIPGTSELDGPKSNTGKYDFYFLSNICTTIIFAGFSLFLKIIHAIPTATAHVKCSDL